MSIREEIMQQVRAAFDQDMEEVEAQVLANWRKHIAEHPVDVKPKTGKPEEKKEGDKP